MKICPRCKRELPAEAFYKRRGGQLSAYCKDCSKAYSREWGKNRPPRRPHQTTEQRLKYLRTLRFNALIHLSPDGVPKCAVCGFDDDLRLLQIDHIHNNGAEERRKLGSRSSECVYVKLLKMSVEEARKEYQVLCALHNWAKRYGITGEEYKIIVV